MLLQIHPTNLAPSGPRVQRTVHGDGNQCLVGAGRSACIISDNSSNNTCRGTSMARRGWGESCVSPGPCDHSSQVADGFNHRTKLCARLSTHAAMGRLAKALCVTLLLFPTPLDAPVRQAPLCSAGLVNKLVLTRGC